MSVLLEPSEEDAMGLFDKRDKKRKDDFDSPVESIDLSAPAPEPAIEMTAEPAGAGPAETTPEPAPVRSRDRAPAPEPEPDDSDEYDTGFGIQKAIELMRTLPADNVELVVQVVKLTLESTKIRISHIIDDATRKQDDIQGRIKVLNAEIADFEREIAQRKEEIGTLEADFAETSTVKERLLLAEKLTDKPSTSSVTSGGRDQAQTSGSIGGPGGLPSPRPSLGSKTSVLVKK